MMKKFNKMMKKFNKMINKFNNKIFRIELTLMLMVLTNKNTNKTLKINT